MTQHVWDDAAKMAYLSESIRYFNQFGMMLAYSHSTSDQLLEQFRDVVDGWNWRTGYHRRFMDHRLLHRMGLTWEDDMEDSSTVPGYYVGAIQQWSAISRGAFQPSGVTEHFGFNENKPTVIEFDLGGEHHILSTDFDTYCAWLDLSLFDKINDLIWPTNKQFVFAKFCSQYAVVYCLTASEQDLIRQDRGWVFAGDKLSADEKKSFWEAAGIPEAAEYDED